LNVYGVVIKKETMEIVKIIAHIESSVSSIDEWLPGIDGDLPVTI
jgi:hypothetical protein